MKRIDQTDEERVARKYRQRTIHNWKKQYGFVVPFELFDEFKRQKRHYVGIFRLNNELVKLIADTPVPPEFIETKERKD